jgi:hypothetical protein
MDQKRGKLRFEPLTDEGDVSMFKNTSRRFALCVIALMTVLALSPMGVQAGVKKFDTNKARSKKQGPPVRSPDVRVQGTITAVDVDAGTVTITTQNGTAVTVTVDANTKIERNGQETTLDALQIGDRGQARYDPATGIASKVEATGP